MYLKNWMNLHEFFEVIVPGWVLGALGKKSCECHCNMSRLCGFLRGCCKKKYLGPMWVVTKLSTSLGSNCLCIRNFHSTSRLVYLTLSKKVKSICPLEVHSKVIMGVEGGGQGGLPVFGYSSNKIRKTQNEHLIIVCQYLIGHEFKVNFLLYWCLYCLVFDLETIGVS